MLILVLVLKDSLQGHFSSPCPCPGPWGSGPCPCPGACWSGPCPCPGPCGSGPCPYPGPCGLVLARTCFHYSIIPIYSHIIVVSMHTISFNYTYLCLSCRHIALHI